MQILLPVHILAGSLGLISGFVALYATKGAPLHRKAGMVFVVVMLTMTTTGAIIAAIRGAWAPLNIPAAVTTAYLVVTALTTVRPPVRGARSLSVGGLLVALAVGLFTLTLGSAAVAGGGQWRGMPAFPFFMFAVIALSGAVGDLRLPRAPILRGAPRLRRHLWRMSMALFITAMSFFLGQAKVIPKPIRIYPLLIVPPLAVLVTMLYWLWRIRGRRTARIVSVGAQEAA